MTSALTWRRSMKKDVYSYARAPGIALEIRRDERRRASRRRAGWHVYWYWRVDGGAWLGDPSRPSMPLVSLAADGHLGFSTMRRAKDAASALAAGVAT